MSDFIMSDSDKLRKTRGNLWLALSFFLLALCVSAFWLIVILHNALIGMLLAIAVISIFGFWLPITQEAYDYFVDVPKKKIDKSDKAQLLRLNGLISLVWSFVVLAIGICFLWGIFVFWGATGFICLILFVLSLFIFSTFVDEARDKFMAIKKVFDEER